MSNDNLKNIANSIRVLSMDAVQKANSGHPGMPMGFADIAAVLWGKIIKHNPDDPEWINRDRVVLSAGHGSMLLYSALHLSGYDISIEDIKNFRQWGSNTPGHPEYGVTRGVETTTGPLGQGFVNAVGMAIARSLLEKEFNTNDNKIIDHYIYALVSDGDNMEGITSEAASIAGHLGLGRLIYIYDYNEITIEGKIDLTFSEDVKKRYEAYGWDVQEIDGHNYDEIEKAILKAQKVLDRPSMIIARTQIAKGSPNKEGSADSHGAPLGEDEIKAVKKNMGWDENVQFNVPDSVYEFFNNRKEELINEYNDWQSNLKVSLNSDLKNKWDTFFSKPDIDKIRKELPVFEIGDKMATRAANGKVLESLFSALPNIIGGSADLSPSNKTFIEGYDAFSRQNAGRNFHFGIREHAMGAIINGIAYYGGFLPYSGTFFVFLDYMRPPVRIAALSELQSIFVFTHDSIFVGEDGPTHQPVEHLASARAIPNLTVIRPADANETREAWLAALDNTTGPSMLLFTRQKLPVLDCNCIEDLHKGAYVIHDEDDPDILVLASGSEVSLSIEASKTLKEQGIKARVISFPSWELFEKQTDDYKANILPEKIKKRVVVETGIKMGWEKYAGDGALYITIDKFGASAPQADLAREYGFTVESVVEKIAKFAKA